MERRLIPYGYRMENGVLWSDPIESEVIRRIFRMRLNGWGVRTIGKQLYQEKLPFFSDDSEKAMKKVSAILYKEIYRGQKDYPAIVSAKDFEAVQALKTPLPCVRTRQQAVRQAPPAAPATEWSLRLDENVQRLEAAVLEQLQNPSADISTVRHMILQLAAEKYRCITAKENTP